MAQKLIRRMEFSSKTDLKKAIIIADKWMRGSGHERANKICTMLPNGKLIVEIFGMAGYMNEEEVGKVVE